MVLSISTGKESAMRYLLQKYEREDHFDVINDDADSLVASVEPLGPDDGGPGYRVQIEAFTECPEFVIKSIDEAIPAVAAYCEANAPQWEPESDESPRYAEMGPCRARYIKDTQFGHLWVDQIESGQWVAYRMGYALSIDGGKIAKFATCEEAQRAADAHFRDGYPNSEMANDGLSWPVENEWWLSPYRLANRARLAVA
jgi:hypothetical protein